MTTEKHQGNNAAPLKISLSRKAASLAFRAVMEKKQTLDQALDAACSEAKLPPRDRAFVVQLVLAALRRYGSLISLLDYMMEKPLGDKVADVRTALLLGMTQVLFMRTDDHAAVNETVNMLPRKRERYRGLVNAILRRCVRERDDIVAHMDASPEEDLPHWLASSWTVAYGKEVARDIALSLRRPPALDITVKKAEDVDALALELEAEVLPTGSLRLATAGGDVTNLSGYDQGGWWVQDLAASLPVKLLGDVKGKCVIDFCAAPGGKTMQLAAAGARVVAVDRSRPRLRRLEENLRRTRLAAHVIADDALTVDLSEEAISVPIDHILLDAPCSATGTLRRNPDLMWCKDPEDIAKLSDLQTRLLDHAFGLLPKGGQLIYCVCSLESREGLDQITAFLDRTPSASRRAITPEEVGGMAELITKDGDMLCLPSYLADQGGMDGFFACRLTKD